jgi:sRNA-binding regulator protein Hfq
MITVDVGQWVKCFLRGGMVLEGFVEEFTDAQAVLRSINDGSKMIIHHPKEDIMLTKIMPEPDILETVETKPAPEPPAIKVQIKNKLQEALQTEDPELQNMNIEELRQLVHEHDRQLIAQKRREHFGAPGNAKMTRYSSPLGKIPRKGE